MKKHHTFILLILMLLFSTGAFSQRDVIFLLLPETGASDENLLYLSKGFYDIFLTDLVSEMERDLPCVGVTDPKTIMLCTQEIRLWATPAFGGQDIRPKIKKISNTLLNPDYIVNVKNYVESEKMIRVEVKCANAEGKLLADFAMPMEVNELLNQDAIPPVKKLMVKLKEYEICPYYGQLSVSTESTRDQSSTSSQEPPCGSGIVTITNTINAHSKLSWELNKEDLHKTSGTMTYENTEGYKTVTDYPCYKCENGAEGALKITDTRNVEDLVEGLSRESMLKGINIDDARIKIAFRDDGTYVIQVDAASKAGIRSENKEKTQEGACQDENKPPVKRSNKIDIPLSTTLGPYLGKPTDKVLTQNVFTETSNGDEKTKIIIKFTLTRK